MQTRSNLIARYISLRLLQLVPILLAISLLTFALLKLAPGDPAQIILRDQGALLTKDAIAKTRIELGLNDSLPVQFARWLGNAVQFNFGKSLRTGRPVGELIGARLIPTVQLALTGLAFALIIAVPLGILAGVKPYSWFDHFGRLAALVGASIPSFWLGLLLIYLFAVQWKLLPAMGMSTPRHLILPALTLALALAPLYMRLIRSSLLEVMSEEYVTTARAKGLRERGVILNHALRNALIPVITVFGLTLAHLLTGTVVVESIFAWPGLGQLAVESILARDFPVVQAFVLVLSLAFVFANLTVDLSYHWLDPRIRVGGEAR